MIELSKHAFNLCSTDKFQRWVERRRGLLYDCQDKIQTIEWLLKACKIDEPKEFDESEYAQKMFYKIEQEFLNE